ncbi:MAG TPA: hypothetical protein VN408_07500 [Actinoplanes sp.]|nr:hypothetical protein [Actinoplanes sp.]
MIKFRVAVAAATVVPAILLSGCAQPGTTTDDLTGGPAVTSPWGTDDLVVRVEAVGGHVPIDYQASALPAVSVYGDGRVITEGPMIEIYPAPAQPNPLVQTISGDLVRQLVDEGVAAGVQTGTGYGQPNVTDMPSTRVTVNTGAGVQTVEAEALAAVSDNTLTPEHRAARARLQAYVTRLQSLATGEGMPAAVAYRPDRLAVLAAPWTSPGDTGMPVSDPVGWPGPALPGPALAEDVDLGCLVVTGAEKDTVWTAASTANALTAWTSGGKKWLVKFRPLLPDENDCVVPPSLR